MGQILDNSYFRRGQRIMDIWTNDRFCINCDIYMNDDLWCKNCDIPNHHINCCEIVWRWPNPAMKMGVKTNE